MKTIEIRAGTGHSKIHIGERLQNLRNHIPSGNMVVLSDNTVSRLYRDLFPDAPLILMGEGESNKTLAAVQVIYQKLLDAGAQRSTFVVGIGGGIVCDVAGYVASTYLRGLRFGFVSTTLLSQVDASVGGKNGVNFQGYKNMIGVFNQPEFVICDLDLLTTLPEKERLCGFAEIVKHAVIQDSALFDYMENNTHPILSLAHGAIEKLVYDSVVIKSGVVTRDEKESGERRKLNFGHTFGHAIEKTAGLAHGEAVSLGMVLASALSVKRGILPTGDAERIVRLLRGLKLPVKMDLNVDELLKALEKDKKRSGDLIHFVLLKGIGEAVIEEIPIRELESLFDRPLFPLFEDA